MKNLFHPPPLKAEDEQNKLQHLLTQLQAFQQAYQDWKQYRTALKKKKNQHRSMRHRLLKGMAQAALVGTLLLNNVVPFTPALNTALATPNTPNFTQQADNPFGLTDVGYNNAPTFADLDGDGDLDAFIGAGSGSIKYFQNTDTATSPAFATSSTNPFGLSSVNGYSTPTFADLDGDGDLDAFSGEALGNIKYFQNTGTATSPAFATFSTNPFGLSNLGYYSSPSFADLDSDGDLDAFIGTSDGNTHYFENIGTTISPTFATASTNPFNLTNVGTNNKPNFVDLDGDGDLDAFIGEHQGSIKYFENIGTVTTPAFAPISNNPFNLADVGWDSSPAFADLDSDGDLDAFIGEYDGSIKYFQNTAIFAPPLFNGPFINPFGLTDVGYYNSPSFADLDGDGDLDAFIGQDTGNIIYFENTGTAANSAFAFVNNNPFGLTNVGGYSTPTFADLDSDGDLDAFIGEYYGNIKYFENTGTATTPAFATVSNNPFGLIDIGFYSSPSFADLDGDGDLDAFIGTVDGTTKYFENTGTTITPAFTTVSNNPFGLTNIGTYNNLSFADLDSDGDLDAFIGVKDGSTHYFENIGTAISPTFALISNNPFGLTDIGFNSSPSFADLDGDGDLDAFIGAEDGNTYYFENTSVVMPSLFTPSTDNPFGLSDVGYDSTPTFADLDDDGDLDAFIGAKDGTTKYFQNTGTIIYPAFTTVITNPFGLTDVVYGSKPTFEDLDGDGDLDAFIGEYYGNIKYFENIGTPVSPSFATVSNNPFGLFDVGGYSTPTFADLDDDGDLDAFIGALYGNTDYFENTGTATSPSFVYTSINPFGLTDVGYHTALSFVDLDDDSDLDVFIGQEDGDAYYFENIGTPITPTFNTKIANPFGLTNVGNKNKPSFADLDGDGDLDAFIGESEGNIKYFENTQLTPVADVSLTKTITPTLIAPGQALTYTLNYHNLSLQLASTVLITDILPSTITGLNLQSSHPITPTGSQSYTLQLGDLAPGSSGIITITGILTNGLATGTLITNTASITTPSTEADITNNISQITITVANAPPILGNDTATLLEDSTANLINVALNDSDPNGDNLTLQNIGPPNQGGTATISGTDTISYTPAADFYGTEVFTYSSSDGSAESTATVTVTINNANNDPPTAVDDTATVNEDSGPNTINVLANDDYAPDPMESFTITLVSQGSNGSVTITNIGADLTYTPNADFYGTDTFTYTMEDEGGLSDTAIVVITVTSVNDDPVAVSDTATTTQNTPVDIDVLANDTDPEGDTLTVVDFGTPGHGSAVISGTSIIYTPHTGYIGIDTFTYYIVDSNGGFDAAIVTITVTEVNDAPLAVDDTATTTQDTPVDVDVLANDTDPEGDILAVTVVSTATHGIVTNNGTTVTYTPDAGYFGSDSFTYTVSDGLATDTATVTITVTEIVEAPALSVSKSVIGSTGGTINLPLGDFITYTIILSNSGNGEATGITLVDTLPTDVSFNAWLTQNGATTSNGTITWSGNLAANSSLSFKFTALVSSGTALYGSTITNTVTYNSTNAGSGTDSTTFSLVAQTVETGSKVYLPLVLK